MIPDPFDPNTPMPQTLPEALALCEGMRAENAAARERLATFPLPEEEKDRWRRFFDATFTSEMFYDLLWNVFENPFPRVIVPFRVDPVDYRMFHLFSRLGYSMFDNPFLPARRRVKLLTYEPIVCPAQV